MQQLKYSRHARVTGDGQRACFRWVRTLHNFSIHRRRYGCYDTVVIYFLPMQEGTQPTNQAPLPLLQTRVPGIYLAEGETSKLQANPIGG